MHENEIGTLIVDRAVHLQTRLPTLTNFFASTKCLIARTWGKC